MSGDAPAFRLERRERIDASSSTALVRLRGTWTADAPVQLGRARLEVAAGGVVQSFDALAGHDAAAIQASPDGVRWRGAFPLPRELADAATAMTLLVEGAQPAQLPATAVRRRFATAGATRAQLAREAEELGAALAQARRDAERFERERDDARSRLGAAEDRAAASEARLHSAARAGGDAGPDHDALRRRIAELESELESTGAQARRVEERLAEERNRLAEATARLREEAEARDRAEATRGGGAGERETGLRAEIELLQAEAAGARGEADELAEELVDTRRRLEEAVERLRAETEARMRAEARGSER